MTYVFDIDGTICSSKTGNYEDSIPFKERILKINDLYDNGHKIIFYTARGMGRYNNKADLAFLSFYELTKKQLKKWGVKYHQLFTGKPSGDIYIDDKGQHDEQFFDKKS